MGRPFDAPAAAMPSSPIAVAVSKPIRTENLWSTCANCESRDGTRDGKAGLKYAVCKDISKIGVRDALARYDAVMGGNGLYTAVPAP
jgi:hypothetical protein